MTGLVLAGAAALGAYEAGVLDYLVERVARDVRHPMPTVICGTSAGAINAMTLAAFADHPSRGTQLLLRAWQELRIDRVFRPSALELLVMALDMTGTSRVLRRAFQAHSIRGGLLDPAPIAKLVGAIPFRRIADHLASGHLEGVAVSATKVSTGEAVVFHQTEQVARPWHSSPNLVPTATQITTHHVLASAAIPLLFPAVTIDGAKYCDGGLRQMVPLAPALHLGADRLLVINPLPGARRPHDLPRAAVVTSPLYLAGKALNALFADRIDADLDRLTRTTKMLTAGAVQFGPNFEAELNLALRRAGEPELRAVHALCIAPSHDLAALATEYVIGAEFRSRCSGPANAILRRVADGDPSRTGDLMAYLMFDGGFTRQLIDLGRADARAHHESLCALFDTPAEQGRLAREA